MHSVSVDRCVLKEKIKGKLTASYLIFALLPAEGCICLWPCLKMVLLGEKTEKNSVKSIIPWNQRL